MPYMYYIICICIILSIYIYIENINPECLKQCQKSGLGWGSLEERVLFLAWHVPTEGAVRRPCFKD